MFEKYLIEHCSPTLASLKTASLFALQVPQDVLARELSDWNRCLNPKGLTLYLLRQRGEQALVYVCRTARLQAELQQPGAAPLLAQYGYEHTDAERAIARLRERLGEDGEFPHEIGLFLGYPLSDVIGFIQNGGRNCKCAGCWKVYGDEGEAQKVFARFKKCKRVYTRLWNEGRSVWRLAVAA